MEVSAESRVRRSLEEVHSSVDVSHPSVLRRLFLFAGPAYMVSVGYMDPGNWATDIAGGSHFGFELLWVLVLSNAIALLLQTLSARLGIVGGRDLAQACRDLYPKPVRVALWLLCEVAIAACDLAEVIGTVIALNLLFNLPLEWGLLVTVFDTFLLLAIQRLGIRKMEAFIIILVFTIGLCFLIEIFLASPEWGAVARGLLPHVSSAPPFLFKDMGALYIAIGIIGATVMPHNLYLHSALVQSRAVRHDEKGMNEACRYNLIDSFLALNAAFFVNASILVLAGAAFYGHGQIVESIEDAHRLLPQFLGPGVAATLFAVALLCSGQSSTLTGTLAGQIVMEGFMELRMAPWMRRLLTRSVAILPAAFVIFNFGATKLQDLLVLSQVILSLQLPFAIVPLLLYTGDRRRMGIFTSPVAIRILGWIAALLIIGLNLSLVVQQIRSWSAALTAAGMSSLPVLLIAWPFVALCAVLLVFSIAWPLLTRPSEKRVRADATAVSGKIGKPQFRRIAVAVENSPKDSIPLEHAVGLARAHGASVVLIHVVDGVGAQWYGDQAADEEQIADRAYLDDLVQKLSALGITAKAVLKFGVASEGLISAVREERADLVVLRAHGHGFFADLLFGHTIERIRHALSVPVLAVR